MKTEGKDKQNIELVGTQFMEFSAKWV